MPKRPTWKVFKTDSEDSSSIASEDDLMRECALQSESGSSFREQDICVQTSSSDFNPATSGSIDSPQNDTPTQGSARSSTSNNPHEEELEKWIYAILNNKNNQSDKDGQYSLTASTSSSNTMI